MVVAKKKVTKKGKSSLLSIINSPMPDLLAPEASRVKRPHKYRS